MDTDPMAELPADVKQHMTRYKAPPGLERRIRHMIAQESRGPGWLDLCWPGWGWLGWGRLMPCGPVRTCDPPVGCRQTMTSKNNYNLE